MRDAGEGAGNDQADVGSTTFERDHEMVMANNARDMLVQTEHALERIDDGSYGAVRDLRQPDRQEAADGVPACDTVPEHASSARSVADRERDVRRPDDRRVAGATPPAVRPGSGRSRSRPWRLRARPGHQDPRGARARPAEPPVEVVGTLLQLQLLRNPGAAFSTGTSLHRR